jgi:hypothetical protein
VEQFALKLLHGRFKCSLVSRLLLKDWKVWFLKKTVFCFDFNLLIQWVGLLWWIKLSFIYLIPLTSDIFPLGTYRTHPHTKTSTHPHIHTSTHSDHNTCTLTYMHEKTQQGFVWHTQQTARRPLKSSLIITFSWACCLHLLFSAHLGSQREPHWIFFIFSSRVETMLFSEFNQEISFFRKSLVHCADAYHAYGYGSDIVWWRSLIKHNSPPKNLELK